MSSGAVLLDPPGALYGVPSRAFADEWVDNTEHASVITVDNRLAEPIGIAPAYTPGSIALPPFIVPALHRASVPVDPDAGVQIRARGGNYAPATVPYVLGNVAAPTYSLVPPDSWSYRTFGGVRFANTSLSEFVVGPTQATWSALGGGQASVDANADSVIMGVGVVLRGSSYIGTTVYSADGAPERYWLEVNGRPGLYGSRGGGLLTDVFSVLDLVGTRAWIDCPGSKYVSVILYDYTGFAPSTDGMTVDITIAYVPFTSL